MKTNYLSSEKSIPIYYYIFLISIFISSCSSYKSSSYYDKDGIYGYQENEREKNVNTKNSDKYRDYFSSLREDTPQEEVLTDIDNYSSYSENNQNENFSENPAQSYSGWGNNQQPINVIINDNNWGWNNWGWNNFGYGSNWNYGWNWNLGWNSWYGPNIGYGWGWNNWYGPNYGFNGWGWNNFYNGNYGGFYGNNFNNNYSYSNGIRGRYRRDNGRYTSRRNNTETFNNSSGRGDSDYNNIRNSSGLSPRRATSIPRNYTPNRTENSTPRTQNSTPRSQNPTPRTEAPTPRTENSTPRNYTPGRSESSSPRSYSPSSNSGSGSSGGRSGGSSGGRSSGSSGRR
ncbi:hypothetical protein MCEGE10_00134 [Flavobacteriaceae bacterium]